MKEVIVLKTAKIISFVMSAAFFAGVTGMYEISGVSASYDSSDIYRKVSLYEEDDEIIFGWDPSYSYEKIIPETDYITVDTESYMTPSGKAYTKVKRVSDYSSGVFLIRAYTKDGKILTVQVEVFSIKDPECSTTVTEATTAPIVTGTTTTGVITTVASTTAVTQTTMPGSTTGAPPTTSYSETTDDRPPAENSDTTTSVTTDESFTQYWIPVNDYGDVNSDYTVDMLDLSTLSLYFLREHTLTDSEYYAADVSFDMKVNVADMAKLKQYLSNPNVVLGPDNIILWR